MKKRSSHKEPEDHLLPRIAMWFFHRPRKTAFIWLLVSLMGVLSYTTFLKREGFPEIQVPFSIVNGTYLVSDSSAVDDEVARLISDIALEQEGVQTVSSQAMPNAFAVFVQYEEGINAADASARLERSIERAAELPPQADAQYSVPKIGFTERGDDLVVTLYAKDPAVTTNELTQTAGELVAYLEAQELDLVHDISVISPFISGVDPSTEQIARQQIGFDRYGTRDNTQTAYYNSIPVGIMQQSGADALELDEQVREAIAAYNRQAGDDRFEAVVSAEFATQIKEQISELQLKLLYGLTAVVIVGSLLIAVRASFITLVAMVTTMAITLTVLLLIGYSLNTITLFALILALALIVDDTIIMVEAIDAQRRKRRNPAKAVEVAARRVSRAMVAATLTACLSFVPLLFVSGILGGFIRAIPVTIIVSLLVSLVAALLFIPLFSRYLLLGKKQMGPKGVAEPGAGVERNIATWLAWPLRWAKHSRKRLTGVGLGAVALSLLFVGGSGFYFQKLTFNILPNSKDVNALTVDMRFAPGTTLEVAERVADAAGEVVAETLDDNFVQASYYGTGSQQSATMLIDIISYNDRDIQSPQLVEQLDRAFEGFSGAEVAVAQQDISPPGSFSARIDATDRETANEAARDMAAFLDDRTLVRVSGEPARITATSVTDPSMFMRADGQPFVAVSAQFDGSDTTALVNLAREAIEDEFDEERLAAYGLSEDAISFDFGQESENQSSFNALLWAFPIAMVLIYITLTIEFRSLFQPLVIFMAIPFSLLGVAAGLYYSDNALSFFAMLGMFTLIGLSIKNTILLTDFANQSRRQGLGPVDAVIAALGERFRPLVATSLTAVVSLTPLALLSPFWEGLAVVLIFGLLSSTFLVLTVFPYYYLAGEYLRGGINRKIGAAWIVATVALSVLAIFLGVPALASLVILVSIGGAAWFATKTRDKKQLAA